MSTRLCIISYASREGGHSDYPRGLKRLIPSALANGHGKTYDSEFLIYSPDIQVDEVCGVKINRTLPSTFRMPSHKDVPYAFKPWLFYLARACGFDQVLWCDSTIVIHKSLDPIWKIAEEKGLFVGSNDGCPENIWTSDDALDKMGCPRDANFWQIMACAIAIDFRHPKGDVIFKEWFDLCNDGVTFAGRSGSSRPEFKAHRHDQAALSWLCQKHGVEYTPYGYICYYGSDMEKFPHHILVNTGIHQA